MPYSILAIQSDYLMALMSCGISAQKEAPAMPAHGSIAVIPIHGPIFQHEDWLTRLFGIPSSEGIFSKIKDSAANKDVQAIVLDIDSPGGSVFGLQEAADQIHEVGKGKKIIAVANAMAASAAYFLGSAASEFYVTPSGQVGSIGVIAAHYDESEKLKKQGIAVEILSSGKYKAEGSSTGPLSDEAREYRQATLDEYYSSFVNSVAKYKSISPDKVMSDFGQGRMLGAAKAYSAGMVTGVASLDEILSSLVKPKINSKKSYFAAQLRLAELA